MAVLVGDQRATVRCATINARLEARLPEDLIATPEGEIDARISRGLDVCYLAVGPILVMASIHEDLVVEQKGAIGGGIEAGNIGNVVAVLLQPIDR